MASTANQSASGQAAARQATLSQRGSLLPEVLVTFGLITGLIGVGILGTAGGDCVALTTARQDLARELRRARMQATLKGARMRFEAHGDRYLIFRLSDEDGDGIWERDQQHRPRQVQLPQGVSVAIAPPDATAGAEFDARGLLVSGRDGSRGIVAITVRDRSGRSEHLQIWPSGQVHAGAAPG